MVRILLSFPESGGSLESLEWGFSRTSRVSKFSRISRKWIFLHKTPVSEPETRVGARRGIFCSTDSGADFRDNGAGFVQANGVDFARIFQLFFPLPKKPRQIHATLYPKMHANFGKFVFNGFSGYSTLVRVAAFGCQYF